MLDGDHRRRLNADQRRRDHGDGCQGQCLQVIAAADGDQPEKEKNEDFAEWTVGDRPRAAGIGPAGGQRSEADGDDGPATVPNEIDAAQECQRKTQPCTGLYAGGRQPALSRGAPGAETIRRIRAAQKIADVVEQVGADLDEGTRPAPQRAVVASEARRCRARRWRCRRVPVTARPSASSGGRRGTRRWLCSWAWGNGAKWRL